MVKSHKLVCSDSKGVQHTRLVAEPLYEQILKLFDGKLRSVHRSTGGLGQAMPTGLKFRDTAPSEISDINDVLVIMNCSQFDPNAKSAESSTLSLQKLIPLARIQDGFHISVEEDKHSAVDFGSGLTGIRVVRYFKSNDGIEMAAFVDRKTYDQAISKRSKPMTIQSYWVPRECLRLSEIEAIKSRPIPEILKLGEPFIVPAEELSLEQLREKVSTAHQEMSESKTKNTTVAMGEEGLLPFGIFEITASVIR